MAFVTFDPYSEFFTPQEFPVEILNIAKNHDVVPCCLPPPAKNFLAFMLFKEFYYQSNGISVYIYEESTGNIEETADVSVSSNTMLSTETKLPQVPSNTSSLPKKKGSGFPFEALSSIPTVEIKEAKDFKEKLISRKSVVLICNRTVFLDLICQESKYFEPQLRQDLNLVVISDVHEALTCSSVGTELSKILNIVRTWNHDRLKTETKPRIRTVFLTISLLHFYGHEANGFWRMEETFRKLEKFCGAKVDTASDIVALLRYSIPPTERIILVGPRLHSVISIKLIQQVKQMIDDFKRFLNAHNYNPAASLGYTLNEFQELIKVKPPAPPAAVPPENEDEEAEGGDNDSLAEELRRIPHPKTAPLEVLSEFEEILDTMGPWCASRAIFLLNNKLAGMKVQVPYVRHFLLLGALHTRLLWIQSIFHSAFDELEPLEVLENFSTPKLIGVLRILRRFDLTKPHESKNGPSEEQDEDEDSDVELTVADYLEQQKQAEQAAAATGKGRFHGRRKHYRSKFDVEKHKRKTDITIIANGEIKEEIVTPIAASASASENVDSAPDIKINDGEGEKIDSSATNGVLIEDEEKFIEKTIAVSPTITPGRLQRRTRFAQRSEDTLCGLLICEDRNIARLLYHFLNEASEADPKLLGLCPTITVPANPEYDPESPEAEVEHKKREESLRKFRYREANFLIGTSLLEDLIELPKANVVIRFDEATSFRSYLLSKGRAQGHDPEYYIFTEDTARSKCLRQLSTFKIVEEMLLANTVLSSPISSSSNPESNIEIFKTFPIFKTASLINSISIVNRYCGRLPSDSFTRLAPSWTVKRMEGGGASAIFWNCDGTPQFSCTIRLPINSPVKWPIIGIPMPSERLAKKAVALQAVMILYYNGELDESLIPIGKEGVAPVADLDIGEDVLEEIYGEFRPGSTRRRQYYDKQLSPELLHCLPQPVRPVFLYWLKMVLTCPLPDDQNTRGRKLYPPEVASQAFGILLSKEVPPIPAFPIYTRCGEVHVELIRVPTDDGFGISESEFVKLSSFHHYTFTSVLRLDKYLTLFDPDASENSYFVVPLKSSKRTDLGTIEQVELDWDFVNRIWNEKDSIGRASLTNQDRKEYKFQREIYMDAVVTPWYRNNDQPQFFYVAEICTNLTPMSQFPGCEFKTFEEYYHRKYNLSINDPQQPLLDVDHTSARLNFLTPRYVNRKGLPLPTSSEATKRAKRENLEQKQILIPELCAVHPFAGSLWRQAVCLPCILYRVNSLLLANSIRSLVARQVRGLGVINVPTDFRWDTMSFGWSLQEVFGIDPSKPPANALPPPPQKTKLGAGRRGFRDRSKQIPQDRQPNGDIYPTIPLPDSPEIQKNSENGNASNLRKIDTGTKHWGKKDADAEGKTKDKEDKKEDKEEDKKEEKELSGFEKAAKEATPAGVTLAESLLLNSKKHVGKSLNEILSEKMKKCRQPELEIGTWSNDMASGGTYSEPDYDEDEDELLDPNVALPSNLMMLDKNWTWGGRSKLFNHRVHRALYGSPTHWGEVWDRGAFEPPEDFDNPKRGHGHDDDNMSVNSDSSGSDESYLDGDNNLKIQFEGNTAEAMDKRKAGQNFNYQPVEDWTTTEDLWWKMDGIDDENEDSNDEENKDNFGTSFKKETILKESFEQRVEEKMNGIQHVLNWDQIGQIPPRAPKKYFHQEEGTDTTKTSALEQLLTLTSLTAPAEVTDDNGILDKNLNGVKLSTENSEFSFDYSPPLHLHCGPSPSQILQALTMSNANDGQNLERLETIGDSFLKYAITSYLFCTYENIHEGKLSHLRSKQVSNIHLYRLGRRRGFGGVMVSAKFEPHDNWLPPCYHIPKDLDKALIQSQIELGTGNFSMAQVNALKGLTVPEIEHALKNNTVKPESEFIPYNLVTQQSIPDKSIADCVEALIGAYLTSAGPHGALLFMSWLGMRVLPSEVRSKEEVKATMEVKGQDSLIFMDVPRSEEVIVFDVLKPPRSPLLKHNDNYTQQLQNLLKGYEKFEDYIGYSFRDKSYLLQAFTHASYATNTLTDCYQRLEFLGDAILDYVITRHLYEDKRQHSPGSLTDLRSALVNNTIFASLAVKHGFHLYFRHSSPGLTTVLQKFVTFQEEHAHTLTPDYYLMGEDECDEAEDIEVPKALGDVFESVAGAIFLDSGMSLDAVWHVYYKIMKDEIEQFSQNVPKSPIRELLEMEPETAKFSKPEKLWDGRRVRVSVEIIGVGVFRGIGRNYRIAKCTAAKCALRHLRRLKFSKNRGRI